MRIICESIGFKNFLSFGSQWQDIPLKNGVNFVTGYDKDKDKSNGAGKSSFLEAIPFALYGKTARNIKQDQIVNWKNKKNCEVVLRFIINDDTYEILRALKPNKLEIYKNGTLLDQDAKKTDYQTMFEQDIFGIDMKMFMSLIHSNVNSSSANIMSMNKPEKRVFMEKMFGLEIYSSMNTICNEKLRSVEGNLYKYETDLKAADEKKEQCHRMKAKYLLDINSAESIFEDIKDKEEALKELIIDHPGLEGDIDQTKAAIEGLKEESNKAEIAVNKKKTEIEQKIVNLKEKLLTIEKQASIIENNKKIKAYIDKIEKELGDKDAIEAKIKEYENQWDGLVRFLSGLSDKVKEINDQLIELKAEARTLKNNYEQLKDGVCPVCGSDVTDPRNHYEAELVTTESKIKAAYSLFNKCRKNVETQEEKIEATKREIKSLEGTLKNLYEAYSRIKDTSDVGDKEELEKELSSLNKTLKKIESEHETWKSNNKAEISSLTNKLNDLNEEYNRLKGKEKEIELLKAQAKTEQKHIKSLKKQIEEQDKEIEIAEHNKHMANQGIQRTNNIKDYLNAMKTILLDKNIKQFSIKQIMPYLNKQANHYLSEVNYSFYVNIDNWLDVDIRGPGIFNATYDSLSGGERRGIDLAIQLSLLDIERTQAGIFPDLLIFDELLDSSIDSKGINEVLNIIRIKQKEFGGKVFVISHRPELDSDIIDNLYRVIKENGYSKVII